MKKFLLRGAALIALTTVFYTGCKKDDTNSTPDNSTPDITLIGNSTDTVSLNSPYTDPGATAIDVEDGVLVPTSDYSATNPDVNHTGTYTITYSVTDSAGATATATRKVIVRNDAYYLAGNYSTIEDTT